MSNYVLITLGVFLVICASFDVFFRRIPNWLTYPAMLMAVLYHCIVGGTAGLAQTLGGLGVGMAMLMPFYLLKGMGAGDVKLMGVVGACLGPRQVFHAFLWTGLTGGLYALILLAFHPHQLVIFLKNCPVQVSLRCKVFPSWNECCAYPPDIKGGRSAGGKAGHGVLRSGYRSGNHWLFALETRGIFQLDGVHLGFE